MKDILILTACLFVLAYIIVYMSDAVKSNNKNMQGVLLWMGYIVAFFLIIAASTVNVAVGILLLFIAISLHKKLFR